MQSASNIFWDMFDISHGTQVAINRTRGLKKGTAVIVGIGYALATMALALLVYWFDILPTLAFASQWGNAVIVVAHSSIAWLAQYAVLLFTIFPTIMELTATRFNDLSIIKVLIWFLLFFDYLTDWPFVQAMLAEVNFDFVGAFGSFAVIAEYVVGILFTILASIGFEYLFVVMLVATLSTFINAGRGG